MKFKTTLFIAIFFVSISNAQQSKVGTVDSEFIISKMPQMKGVLKRLENYSKQLDSTFQLKAKDYKAKIDALKKEEKTLSEENKKARVQEIVALEQDMGKFRQNGSTLMQLRRDEYMRPLYKKLTEVINEIAKANNYTQILTTTGNQFAFLDERFDITKKVMDKLGIKE